MKLTKEKLEQLIMEEYKNMSRRIFDKRRQYPKDGTIRAFGDEDQPLNKPELHDKLTAVGSSGPKGFNQAKELADTLDEPLNVKHDPSKMRAFGLQGNLGPFSFEEMKQETWFDYVMTGYADNFEDPIDPNQFEKYVNDKGIRQDKKQEVYNKLESERSKLLQKLLMSSHRGFLREQKSNSNGSIQAPVNLRSIRMFHAMPGCGMKILQNDQQSVCCLERNASDRTNFKSNTWNISDGVAFSTETGHHDLIVIRDVIERTVSWDKGCNFFTILSK